MKATSAQPASPASTVTFTRIALALLAPPALGILLQAIALFGLARDWNDPIMHVLLLAGVGIGAWTIALRTSSLVAVGLRGGRPFYFALVVGTLAALPLFILRLGYVPIGLALPDSNALSTLAFEVVFAGGCVLLWLLGVLYNAIRDVVEARAPGQGAWRAALICGLLYGVLSVSLLGIAAPLDRLTPAVFAYQLCLGITLALGRWRSNDNVSGLAVGWGLLTWITWDMLPNPNQSATIPATAWLLTAAAQAALAWLLWPRGIKAQQEAVP